MTNIKTSAFKQAQDFQTKQLTVAKEIIATQQALLALVRSVLPIEIAEHAHYCVSSGKRLLIYTESANWASQIRFFNDAILTKMAAAGQLNIAGLSVKVMAQYAEPQTKRPPRLPSRQNIQLIRELAGKQENQDDLQQSMQRLADALERRANK
ncbi:MAG: DciA family protein [Methylomonas sp.]|jgi:hypothetical protein